MKGLLIREPWVSEILSGRKNWEIRGSSVKIRGEIALIRSGSGLVVGTCELAGVHGPLSMADLLANADKHRIPEKDLLNWTPYKRIYAWELKNAKAFSEPIPYAHPQGAVIWVNLGDIAL